MANNTKIECSSNPGNWKRHRHHNIFAFTWRIVRGGRLSADAVQDLLAKHVAVAAQGRPSLRKKRVTPHVLRHAAAMELLQSGVDRSIIALWLWHESIETTQIYIDADLALKEKVLAKTTPSNSKQRRFRAKDSLLEFLKGL